MSTVLTTTILVGTCSRCGRPWTVKVPDEGLTRMSGGDPLQRAFPDLSDAERELLKTGYCSPCFDALFPVEEI